LLLLFKSSDHLIVTEDLYGGTYRLFEQCFARYGLEFTYVDTTDLDAVRRAVRDETRALFVESLTNPLLKVTDIAQLASFARDQGFLTIVDNTSRPASCVRSSSGRTSRSTAAPSTSRATTTRYAGLSAQSCHSSWDQRSSRESSSRE